MPDAESMSHADDGRGSGGRAAVRAACVLLALACLPAIIRAVLSVPLHLSLNYNEGWNAYHTLDLVSGRALYSHTRSFFFNNYPPLSFYIVAAWTRVAGDPIVAGRTLSMAAFLLWTIVLARAAERFGIRHPDAWFGALSFAATTLLFTDYVGIDDPQLLGDAIAASGLLVLQRAPRTVPRLFVAALLFSIGVFIKQNLIALPLACIAWLLTTDRSAGWRLIGLGAVCGAAGFAVFAMLCGPGFVIQLMDPRAYLPLKGVWMAVQWIVRWLAALGLLWIVCRQRPDDEAVRFCAIYVCIAGGIGFVLSGGAGTNWNVLFDASWAVCLGIAVVLDRWRRAEQRGWLMAACLIVPAIAVVAGVRPESRSAGYWLTPRSAEAADAARGIDFLAHHDGPALCEDLALCFWAGKPVEVDVFNTQQNILRGKVDAADLVRLVEAHYFGAVQMEPSPRDLGGGASQALRRRYRVDHEDVTGWYLLPR